MSGSLVDTGLIASTLTEQTAWCDGPGADCEHEFIIGTINDAMMPAQAHPGGTWRPQPGSDAEHVLGADLSFYVKPAGA